MDLSSVSWAVEIAILANCQSCVQGVYSNQGAPGNSGSFSNLSATDLDNLFRATNLDGMQASNNSLQVCPVLLANSARPFFASLPPFTLSACAECPTSILT